MMNNDHMHKARPTLGVVAICKDEAVNLPGFLGHLLPWVDEIVVVDDGSTDGTLAMLYAAGPKVTVIESPRGAGEYFAAQRNKGLDAARSDWLLHLDFDERITPDLRRAIEAAIRDERRDGYYLRNLNFFLHRPVTGSGWDKWRKIRLARRDKSRWDGAIHENLVVNTPAERIGELEPRMWHLNDTTFQERVLKSYHYGMIEVGKLQKRGFKVRWFHLVVTPVLNFLKGYVLKRGYRDGIIGLLMNMQVACATFRVYALVWDEQNRIPRAEIERQFRELSHEVHEQAMEETPS